MAEKTEAQLVAYREEFAEILPTVTRWHEMAIQHSRLAIWFAAVCGQELINQKKKIGHGGWMKYLKVLPFSDDTARRYMETAVEWQKRIGQISEVCGISNPKLLGETIGSTIELSSDQYKEIAEATSKAVGDTTLRQLWFAWGICKDYSRPGGDVRKDKGVKMKAPTEAEIQQTYRVEWMRILEDVTEHGRRQRTYVHLEDGELENHRAGLAYVVSELDDEIKRRGNAKKGKK
jgi:hypothetical protein